MEIKFTRSLTLTGGTADPRIVREGRGPNELFKVGGGGNTAERRDRSPTEAQTAFCPKLVSVAILAPVRFSPALFPPNPPQGQIQNVFLLRDLVVLQSSAAQSPHHRMRGAPREPEHEPRYVRGDFR